MSVTWGQVKEEFRDAFRDVSGSVIGNEELKRMIARVLRLIDNAEAYTFQEQTYTLTLTGAAQYDLDALISGWKRINSITNTIQGASPLAIPMELKPVSVKDFQIITDRYVYTIFGNRYLQIYSPSGASLLGTLQIIYYTGFLVRDGVTNNLKAAPTQDSDYFILPDRYCDVLVEGLLMLAWRKDRSNKDDYRDAVAAFTNRKAELIETFSIQQNEPVRSMMGAF